MSFWAFSGLLIFLLFSDDNLQQLHEIQESIQQMRDVTALSTQVANSFKTFIRVKCITDGLDQVLKSKYCVTKYTDISMSLLFNNIMNLNFPSASSSMF